MLKKSRAIDRLLRENPDLADRRFGLPAIGGRDDKESFNPTVQEIADAIEYYGYEIRDNDITVNKDIDLGGGNPLDFKPFPLSIDEMIKSLKNGKTSRYPYTEGDDKIRQILLDYIEEEGFINTTPYSYKDIDERGLCVHNITFMPSTSLIFNTVINVISKPGDVILITGPSYGLFTIRAERNGAEVEILPLEKEDNFLINPSKLANKIDDINESLQKVYQRRKGYVPRVVAFLNANPNNPTGKVMGKDDIERLTEIGNVCLERGVFIIDDLVYRDIVFEEENKAVPIATIPGMFRNTISLFGLSKSYGLASLRAGFVVADEIIIREIINRIFQEMDSSPDIVGQALKGAFNTTKKRKIEYKKYFDELREEYKNRFLVLKALVNGINSIPYNKKEFVKDIILKYGNEKQLDGLPFVNLFDNLEPDAGFFAILDFTKIKGMKYHGRVISSEQDLLKFFYRSARIRFLVGKSISWPYKDELIGRISFATSYDELVYDFDLMLNSLNKLKSKNDYVIRFNKIEDQEQMAHIKIDGWRTAYDTLIQAKYLNSLNYEEQTKRYIQSFEEYKELVLVAERNGEILGYSCFNYNDNNSKFDAELVSLYIKNSETGRGIGSTLLIETSKVLFEHGKRNMIIWCLKDNIKAINFYTNMGGTIVEEKTAIIGDNEYEEVGLYFDLKKTID